MTPRMIKTSVALVVAVGLVLLGAPLAHAAGPTATFTKTSDWGTGYEGRYTITNATSTTMNGWRVEFDLPTGVTVNSHWDAALTRNGNHYSFTNSAGTARSRPARAPASASTAARR